MDQCASNGQAEACAKGLAKALEKARGVSGLANLLNLQPPSVWEWKERGRVPAGRCLDVEAVTGVSRYELRPDIFGAPQKRQKAA